MAAGRKSKFDFEDPENLVRIEGWARDGLDDKQIAAKIGYNESHFSTLKGKIAKLSNALKKGRAPLEYAVENNLYKKTTWTKIKTQQAIKLRDIYYDENGNRCQKERVEVVDLIQEVPPDTTASIFWLKNRKPEVWNKPAPRIENEDDIPSSIDEGINIEEWVKHKIKKQ